MKSARFLALALLAGCAPRLFVKPPGDPAAGVLVRWWGHSCFSLTDSAGRTILIDPFDDSVDYPAPTPRPDALLVTHAHFDHANFPGAAPEPLLKPPTREPDTEDSNGPGRGSPRRPAPPRWPYAVVRTTGTHTAAGVEVVGVPADHDDQGGRRHGFTAVYVWGMGGLRFAHLGDIGQTSLRPDQRAALAGVDVLFVPVGGKTTVDAAGAWALIKEIAPRAVVPMHYGTARVRFFEFEPIHVFLRDAPNVRWLDGDTFRVRRDDLTSDTAVYVPAPPGTVKKEAP
ncbi:MAG: MBL fold metallo-hydrolase [Elusimicrobia bacterium]|nr:MBL fold metallo-hydrolase [Elusimicrobiota bacterium]